MREKMKYVAAPCNPSMKEGSVIQAAAVDYNDLLNSNLYLSLRNSQMLSRYRKYKTEIQMEIKSAEQR